MTSEEHSESDGDEDVQPIPKEVQDISLEKLVEADYEVVSPAKQDESGHTNQPRPRGHRLMMPPGRFSNQDSIEASSENIGEDPHHDAYAIGFDSPMATRIGNEWEDDDGAERLRELHEGRHQSDGNLSKRLARVDKERISQAICSQLPLTKREREKVVGVVTTIDFSRFGSVRSIEAVTLGTVAVVVDEQHRQLSGMESEIVSFTDDWSELCNSADVSMSELRTVKQVIRDALEDGKATTYQSKTRRRDPLLPNPTPISERSDGYWNDLSPERWEWIAKQWEQYPEDLKTSVPDEYVELVEQLRRWEPWKDSINSLN